MARKGLLLPLPASSFYSSSSSQIERWIPLQCAHLETRNSKGGRKAKYEREEHSSSSFVKSRYISISKAGRRSRVAGTNIYAYLRRAAISALSREREWAPGQYDNSSTARSLTRSLAWPKSVSDRRRRRSIVDEEEEENVRRDLQETDREREVYCGSNVNASSPCGFGGYSIVEGASPLRLLLCLSSQQCENLIEGKLTAAHSDGGRRRRRRRHSLLVLLLPLSLSIWFLGFPTRFAFECEKRGRRGKSLKSNYLEPTFCKEVGKEGSEKIRKSCRFIIASLKCFAMRKISALRRKMPFPVTFHCCISQQSCKKTTIRSHDFMSSRPLSSFSSHLDYLFSHRTKHLPKYFRSENRPFFSPLSSFLLPLAALPSLSPPLTSNFSSLLQLPRKRKGDEKTRLLVSINSATTIPAKDFLPSSIFFVSVALSSAFSSLFFLHFKTTPPPPPPSILVFCFLPLSSETVRPSVSLHFLHFSSKNSPKSSGVLIACLQPLLPAHPRYNKSHSSPPPALLLPSLLSET